MAFYLPSWQALKMLQLCAWPALLATTSDPLSLIAHLIC